MTPQNDTVPRGDKGGKHQQDEPDSAQGNSHREPRLFIQQQDVQLAGHKEQGRYTYKRAEGQDKQFVPAGGAKASHGPLDDALQLAAVKVHEQGHECRKHEIECYSSK